MLCKKCNQDKGDEFYANDSSCKECRKAMVRANRAKNAEYYREYDRVRYQKDPKIRQRHRRYQATEAGKQSIARSNKKWKEQHPVKRAANIILGNAVRSGKIKKPSRCSECGSTGKIHGHHDDYARPLSVRWLCPCCHTKWHKDNGEGANPA